MSHAQFLEAITSTALSHDEHCECEVCRAAAGDERALRNLLSTWVVHQNRRGQ